MATRHSNEYDKANERQRNDEGKEIRKRIG